METPNYDTAQTINFRIYGYFGYWTTTSQNRLVQRLYNIYSVVVLTIATVNTILQIMEVKDSWSDLEKLSSNLSATTTSIFSLFKVYSMKLRFDRVERLRRKLREFLNVSGIGDSDEDREIFERNASGFMRICRMFYYLVWSTIFLWCCVSGINSKLPVRQWFPFELDDYGVIYYSVYVYQCIHLFYFAGIVIFMDLIFCGFIFLICSHFDVLEKNIRKFGSRISAQRRAGNWALVKGNQERIGHMVRHHQEILKTAEEVDDLFRTSSLIHFLGVAVLISVQEYDLIQKTEQLNTQFFHELGNLGSAFFDLFFYSYYGTLLEEKSKNIGFAVYDVPWFDLVASEQKMLQLMMARCRKPARITAGRMFAINFETYLAVMRSSYNLLAVLRQTKS